MVPSWLIALPGCLSLGCLVGVLSRYSWVYQNSTESGMYLNTHALYTESAFGGGEVNIFKPDRQSCNKMFLGSSGWVAVMLANNNYLIWHLLCVLWFGGV